MKLLRISLLLCYSCTWGQPVNYDPHFFVHDYLNMDMVDRDEKHVSCGDVEWNSYASLSKEKIKELAEIIKRARLPKELDSQKSLILKELYQASR